MKKYNFPAQCYSSICSAFKDIGFQRVSDGVFFCEISVGIFGWVGLNRVKRTLDKLELYPIVGVVHSRINKLIFPQNLLKKLEMTPTVSTPLCYLVNDDKYKTWVFSSDVDYEIAVVDMKKSVQGAGRDFINKYSNLESLYLEAIEIKRGDGAGRISMDYERTIPAALYCLGKYNEVISFIENERKINVGSSDGSAFRIFENRLIDEVEKSRRGLEKI